MNPDDLDALGSLVLVAAFGLLWIVVLAAVARSIPGVLIGVILVALAILAGIDMLTTPPL